MTPPGDLELDPRDHLAILDLISEYAHCFDSGEIDAFADLFTLDGSLTTPVGDGTTRAGIRQWAERRWDTLRSEGVSPRHFQTNTQLNPTGPGTVRGTTQLLLVWLSSTDGVAQLKGVARYDDEFRKTAEGWRFYRRRIGASDPAD